MNERLIEIIRYKTGGKQIDFANLMGWAPQYLTKLLKGDNFGLQPILTILEKLPEINARWFLFGKGEMLEIGKLFELQRKAMSHIQYLLDLDKFIPYMTADQINEFEQAVKIGRKPYFSPDTLLSLQDKANEHEDIINAKFSAAIINSKELCNPLTAKK